MRDLIYSTRVALGRTIAFAALFATTTLYAQDSQYASLEGDRLSIPAVQHSDSNYALTLKLLPGGPPYLLEEVSRSPLSELPAKGASTFAANWLDIPVLAYGGKHYYTYFKMTRQFPPLYELRYSAPLEKGSFITPLEGVRYLSGRRVGTTDADGSFFYEAGQPATFSVGGYQLGSAVAGKEDLAFSALFTEGEADPDYIAALRTLEILDEDLNTVNGIAVDSAKTAAAASELKSLASTSFEADYAALVTALQGVDATTLPRSALAAEVEFQKLEIQTHMLEKLAEKSIPGVSLAIRLKDGKVWETAAGVANTATDEAMTPAHRLRVGSATKSFTAMWIMQLVDEGLLTLDQTVEEFLPNRFPHGEDITIKMLLNHTAGLFSFTNEYPGFQEDFGVTFDPEPDPTEAWFFRYMGTPDFVYEDGELITIGARTNTAYSENDATPEQPYLMNEPGIQWNYSNTHYVTLQEIGEQITLNSWESEIQSRFVEPLGLTSTIVPSPGDFEIPGLHARGYINWANFESPGVAAIFGYPNGDIERTNTDPAFTMGSGAIISTTGDLVRWATAVVEGELLSDATMALLFDPFLVTSAFEAQIEMLQGIVHQLSLQAFGHRGQIAGYDASWQYRYEDEDNIVGTGTPTAIVLNRTLMTEYAEDGTPTILNVNSVMLEGIYEILFGE